MNAALEVANGARPGAIWELLAPAPVHRLEEVVGDVVLLAELPEDLEDDAGRVAHGRLRLRADVEVVDVGRLLDQLPISTSSRTEKEAGTMMATTRRDLPRRASRVMLSIVLFRFFTWNAVTRSVSPFAPTATNSPSSLPLHPLSTRVRNR